MRKIVCYVKHTASSIQLLRKEKKVIVRATHMLMRSLTSSDLKNCFMMRFT